MDDSRRSFIRLTAASAAFTAGMLLPSALLRAAQTQKIRAIAFDAFPIFDPRSVFAILNTEFPAHGDKLRALWFPKIFGYSWLRTAAGHYKPFRPLIEDALVQCCAALELELSPAAKARIMEGFMHLQVWPDVKPALETLRGRGVRLAFLSNMDEEMLRTNARAAGIEDLFEFYLSTDRVQAYKPAPHAYRMGVEAFDLPKQQIAFAAFAGWDAAGAAWFGYPTVWVNRLGAAMEELDARPALVSDGLDGLVNFTAGA